MLARNVVNQITYQYLIPTLQVGSKVVIDRTTTGRVLDVYGVDRSLRTVAGCLRCNDLVNLTKLPKEVVADEQQRRTSVTSMSQMSRL